MRLASRFCNPILSNDPCCVSPLPYVFGFPPRMHPTQPDPTTHPTPQERSILNMANHMQENREVNVALHDLHAKCTIFLCWIVLECRFSRITAKCHARQPTEQLTNIWVFMKISHLVKNQ